MACLGTPVVSIVHHPCPLHLQQILLPCRSNTVIQDTVKEDTFEAGTGYIKHIHIIYIYIHVYIYIYISFIYIVIKMYV